MTLPSATAYAARAMRAAWVVCASFVLFAASQALAQAEDERLQLMQQSIAYTDVIDSFDGLDRFDLDVHLGYARLRELGAIHRELTRADGTRALVHVADGQRDLSQLSLGIDVGLFRDLMATLRLPLILRDARALRLPAGADGSQVAAHLSDVPGLGEAPVPLFTLPMEAPARAGLDYLALGAAWSVLNQLRTPHLPTWVLRIEGRRALGDPLRACRQQVEGGTVCGTQGSDDRDGDGAVDGTRSAAARPGASRGMSGVLLETRFSRRYRRAEPYAGLSLLVEWPAYGKRADQRRDATVARPGPESALALGLALVPWENRASFKRLSVDVRLSATHVARGTDYSVLFDALGSSSHPELARGRYQGVRGAPPGRSLAPCVNAEQPTCGVGGRVQFDGRSELEPHLRYAAQLGLEVQAARYVRFALGSSVQWTTEHALTDRAACGESRASAGSAIGDDGRTCSEGRADPRQRGVIDAPGRRFVLRDQLLLGVYAQATASF